MRPKRWAGEAERALLQGIGFYGADWFQRQGGPAYDYPNAPQKRSKAAVYAKARQLFGRGGLTRGVQTLARLARESGYHPKMLKRAGSALNQKWKRLGPRGVYLLTDEQVEDILEWLKHDFWCKSLHLYACVWCGRNDQPPKGAGLCGPCYYRQRRYCVSTGLPASMGILERWLGQVLRLVRWTPGEAAILEAAQARLIQGKSLAPGQLVEVRLLLTGARGDNDARGVRSRRAERPDPCPRGGSGARE